MICKIQRKVNKNLAHIQAVVTRTLVERCRLRHGYVCRKISIFVKHQTIFNFRHKIQMNKINFQHLIKCESAFDLCQFVIVTRILAGFKGF